MTSPGDGRGSRAKPRPGSSGEQLVRRYVGGRVGRDLEPRLLMQGWRRVDGAQVGDRVVRRRERRERVARRHAGGASAGRPGRAGCRRRASGGPRRASAPRTPAGSRRSRSARTGTASVGRVARRRRSNAARARRKYGGHLAQPDRLAQARAELDVRDAAARRPGSARRRRCRSRAAARGTARASTRASFVSTASYDHVAELGRLVDALDEVGEPAPRADHEHALVDDVDARAHQLRRASAPAAKSPARPTSTTSRPRRAAARGRPPRAGRLSRR